jgi:tripartite-type tricarboxylate transporter receptor subunit TctC
MDPARRGFLHLAAGSAVSLAAPRLAWAQPYPARPVRVIVPFAPGGIDVVVRVIAQKLSEHLGQQFYVENIGGAGGNIGTSRAAQAPADGYTVLSTAPAYVINPALYDKVSYDPRNDFHPVTLAATTPLVLTINPSVPAQTVKELVAVIRSNPGKYSYASAGTGTPPHLAGELFRLSLGLDLVHIPYTSGGLAIGSTVAGHTPISFAALAPAVAQVHEGKLRALAVASKTRSQALPGVPTMTEAGYPDIEGEVWSAFLVPARTPKEIVTLLHDEIVRAIALADVKERLAVLGYTPVGSTPGEFAEQIRLELATWARVIREAGLKVQ